MKGQPEHTFRLPIEGNKKARRIPPGWKNRVRCKCIIRPGAKRKKAAGHMIRQPSARVYAGGVDPRWLCVAEEWGAARLRIAADPENLYRILIFAAAHGAAVCDQHA